MGMPIRHPISKTSILAVEGLKKLKMATPPSTRSTNKVNATEHGNAIFQFVNTLREIRAHDFELAPFQVLENKGPQNK